MLQGVIMGMLVLANSMACDDSNENNTPEEKKKIVITNGEGALTPIVNYPAQDYSGITWLGNNRYAVVTDKKDGFYEFSFEINTDGSISSLSRSEFKGDSTATRDCEGIVYYPSNQTVFISGEADQEILEYNRNGIKTGTKLNVPSIFKQETGNYGFESLGYDPQSDRFWTTTESTLKTDGEQASGTKNIANLHRIQSFDGKTFEPGRQYAYKAEVPEGKGNSPMSVIGIPAITALPDGRLLILEREFFFSQTKDMDIELWVKNKLFLTDPELHEDVSGVSDLRNLEPTVFMDKTLLWEKKTELSDSDNPLANYEGMCLGPVLEDGSHTLILMNDSQGGFMSLLKEYLLVLKFEFR